MTQIKTEETPKKITEIITAFKWIPELRSTEDGMVWFDGKRIGPNDAKELGQALTFLATSAFALHSHSIEVPIRVTRSERTMGPILEKKPE